MPTNELPIIDGREPKLCPHENGCRIVSNNSREFYLNDEGKWESYRGQYKSWPTEAAAIEFLRSLAPASEPLDTFGIGLALLDDLAEVEATQKEAITAPAAKERLGSGDAGGWYFCELIDGDRIRKVVRLWDGKQLCFEAGDYAGRPEKYTNFRGPLVANTKEQA